MTSYIAFLRAINVGGHNVKMDVLRALFEELAYTGVETYIASGNVVFDAHSGATRKLESRISEHLHQALGYEVACFIRTRAELAGIISYQAFSAAIMDRAGAFSVALLAGPLSKDAKQALDSLKTEVDDFVVHGREVYWLCKTRQSESKFSNKVFEKSLGVKTTFRGIRTLQRLVAKYPV